MRWVIVFAGVGLLGCAEQVTADRQCVIESQRFLVDDPQVILRMKVASNADRCVVYIGTVVGKNGGAIIQQPSHGAAEIHSERTQTNVRGVSAAVGFGSSSAEQIAFGAVYHPTKGYVGDDEFTFNAAPARRNTFTVHIQVVNPVQSTSR